ncbi:MAG TPA: methyltransferase, partial [Rhodopila sp.]|uniref:methyltransferase n=1 Tax=Rhodopila sp. TaxID=2480087 RepID=UPI002C44F95D
PDGAGAMDPDGMPAAFMDAAARSPADLQLALGRFWMSAGIAPAAVFGVGSGEIAAATLAGLRPAGTARPTGAAFISTRTGRIETAWTEGDGDSRLDTAIAAAASAGADVLLVLGDDSACAAGTIARRAVCHTVMDETIWQGVIQAARTLYLAGVDLAWDVFHRLPGQAGARPVLDLPTYAFQRQRYWRPADPVTAAAEKPVQATPGFDWSRLVSAVAQQSETGPLGWDVTRFDARWRAVDALTAGYAIDTLAGFGEFAQPGARATAEDILRRHGIAPGYRNLVYRWMLLLARDGVLQDEGNGVFVSPSPLRRRDLAAAWQAVERLMADDPDMLDYARRTCGKLVDLLTGRTNPLEVLFARGSLDMAEGIYERSPSARYLNAMVASAVRSALADHRGDEPFRLVEAGAGTGGTTSCLAEFFPADGEYWFTDLSDVFLTRAQRRFGKNPAFRFNRLDLEQAPPAELPVGQADVVLAANVIHATRDLAVTLDNMRALLKPGGLLVLLESTTHHSMLDLSIGFVEGWNRFDDAYRSFHPLLDADRWTALLRERGFVTAERFPKAGSVTDRIGQHVIVARNDLDMRAVAAIKRSAPVEAVAAFVAEPVQADKPLEAIGREALERIVRHCAAQVMHLDPATRPGPRERFSDLGMDSLMALQLQTDLSKALGLGDRLPATIAFDTGTVEGLTDEILRLAAPARPEAEPVPVVRATLPGVKSAADLADMSDEEVEALLAQRVLANQMVVSR